MEGGLGGVVDDDVVLDRVWNVLGSLGGFC